ncbi:MAG: hypothetical protein SGILL_003722 [Bacillariaceae sp.]
MENFFSFEQSVPLCCLFAALGGAMEVAATAVTAIPAVREKEGIRMSKYMRWLSVLGNLTLAGIGSILGHLIATWFGPVSLVIPYFFSATLLCNMGIVGLLGEEFDKNMRVGTLVIVVAVILLPVVGPTTQEGQNFYLLMNHWYAKLWFLLLLAGSAVTAILLALDITKYGNRTRIAILLLARATSLCVNVTVSRSFILGPQGFFLVALIVTKVTSGSLYSSAIVVQSFAVDQSIFVPLNATVIMLVNALTGIIIWEEWRCVQSWLGYACVFALLGLACDLLLSVPVLNSENPEFGLNKRVSTIMPVRISTLRIPGKFGYEQIPEANEHEDDDVVTATRTKTDETLSARNRRKSRVEAWREVVTPDSTLRRSRISLATGDIGHPALTADPAAAESMFHDPCKQNDKRRQRPVLPSSVMLLMLLLATTTLTLVSADDEVGSLRVSDIVQKEPQVYQDFQSNTTLQVNGNSVRVLQGSVHQVNNLQSNSDDFDTEFAILPNVLERDTVQQVLQLLQNYPDLDEDPDTVDGMPTYELFVDSPELYQPSTKVKDSDPNYAEERKQLRQQLQSLLQPTLQSIITPFVQQHVSACQHKHVDRACTPCFSLIRRYRHGDRISHGMHHDGHALATVVISLSDYGVDYKGGLYVSTGHGQEREFLQLGKGDAVVHQSTLLHGVHVHDIESNANATQRWSWILWFRDSTECEDYSYEWFADCALSNNPLCQQLHSTKVGNIPGITPEQAAQQILELNQQAAHGGAGMAAIKLARAYLKLLPSTLEFDVNQAIYYYGMAIASSNHPDGHYGMAALYLQEAKEEQAKSSDKNDYNMDRRVVQAVQHLEEAAKMHHAYAQYNLGMAHTYGFGTGRKFFAVAAEWFIQSGLPEGYYIAAQQALAVSDQERHNQLIEQAKVLGFFAPWRTLARESTGSGGAGGVNLNLPWPVAADGREAFHLPSQLPPLEGITKSNSKPDTIPSSPSSPSDDESSIKAMKEAAVTGHQGSSHPWEVLLVCASVVTGCAVYNVALAVLQTKSQILKMLLEAVLLWFPMVLAQSDFLYPYATCVMVIQVVLAVIKMQRHKRQKANRQSKLQTASNNKHLDFLTLYRSSILYLTFIAILAVDFPSLFPRGFCKTEVAGYGLMDVGAASFCISAGLVGARRHLAKASTAKKSVSPWKPFVHTVPLIVIGIVRILVNKELDYQEHVSEYGVHWNFFFTLGILTLVPAILDATGKKTTPSFLGPLSAMVFYQIFLSVLQAQQFIEEAPRRIGELQGWNPDGETKTLAVLLLNAQSYLPITITQFFVANREGILGCIGYLCLYYAGEWVGYHWLWKRDHILSSMTLGHLAVYLWVFHLGLVYILDIPVSRRSTNLGFCSWALAHNVVLLCCLQQLESWIKPLTNCSIVPPIWEKVNAHGLIMFVVANLLTGLVNLTVPTLETVPLAALLIVFGYICCIGLAAYGIDGIYSLRRPKTKVLDSKAESKKKR